MDIKDLHAQIDADIDARIAKHKESIAKLEESRRLDHLAADRLKPRLRALAQTDADVGVVNTANSNGHKAAGKNPEAELFPLRKEMRSWLLGRIGSTVTQPDVYEYLLENFAKLKDRPERSLRAQISGVLAFLAEPEQGFLKLKKRGLAGDPNLYTIVGDKKVEASQ